MILPRTSEGLYLLQRIRDEAHRFAITHHRSRRSKTMVESLLDDVPGLGEVRRKSLLQRFGSLKKLRAATVDEIAEVPGIGLRTAEAIVGALGQQHGPPRRQREHRHRRDLEESLMDQTQVDRPRRAGGRHRDDRRRTQHRRQGARGPRLLRRRQPAAAAGARRGPAGRRDPAARCSRSRSWSTSAPGRSSPACRRCSPRAAPDAARRCCSSRPTTTCWSAARRPPAGRTRCRRAAGCSTGCAGSGSCSTPAGRRRPGHRHQRLNVHQLTAKVAEAFGTESTTSLKVTVVSFGFKYGIPVDADLVADMRFLPNPYWVPELRPLTGRDAEVAAYVKGRPEAQTFLDQYVPLLADRRHRLPPRGQALHDRRDRLHRRQAPQRRDDRGDRRPAAGAPDSTRCRCTVTSGGSEP